LEIKKTLLVVKNLKAGWVESFGNELEERNRVKKQQRNLKLQVRSLLLQAAIETNLLLYEVIIVRRSGQ
jgi:hypothetical protein